VGNVARTGETRNTNNNSVRIHEGERPLGGPRRRWEDDIRKDLCEIGWWVVDWIHLARIRTSCGLLLTW
jgi:hypothetical protein